MNVITEIERLRYFAYLNGVADGLKESRNDINSVLDKIRAEIEEPLKINEGMHTDSAKAQAIALSWCIEIIDKYRGDADDKA